MDSYPAGSHHLMREEAAMAEDALKSLFLYELGLTRNLEVAGDHMLSDITGHVHNRDLARLMEEGEEGRHEQIDHINACLEAVGVSTMNVPDPAVDGLRTRFQTFARMQPAAEALDMFVLGTTLRVTYLGIAAYREAADLAEILGQSQCTEHLRTNVTNKEEFAEKVERLGLDMGNRLVAHRMATAP